MQTIRKILILGSALALSATAALAQGGDGPPGPAGPGRWGPERDGPRGGEMGGHWMARRGMDRRRMRHPGMHRMHDPIARLLEHQTLLHLTPAEVNSIIAIDDKLHNDNKPLVDRLMGMRAQMRDRERGWRGRGRDRADSASAGGAAPSRGQRDSVMTIIRTIRENVWRATAAADAVLTPEQLNTAGTLDPAAHPHGMMPRGPDAMPGGRGAGPRG